MQTLCRPRAFALNPSMNFATANKRSTWPHIPENVSKNLMEMPGRFLTEVAVVPSRRARLQVFVAQTWLAPGGRSRGMNREWESKVPNVSCRVGARPQ